MTYLYYKSTATYNQKPNEKTIEEWKHLADKKNWRITQLANGFYQTECLNPDKEADCKVIFYFTILDRSVRPQF